MVDNGDGILQYDYMVGELEEYINKIQTLR